MDSREGTIGRTDSVKGDDGKEAQIGNCGIKQREELGHSQGEEKIAESGLKTGLGLKEVIKRD